MLIRGETNTRGLATETQGVFVLRLCSPRNQVLVQTKRYAVFVITPTMMIDNRFQVQELAGGKRLTVEGRV